MKRRHPVDLVLVDAAETMLRNRSRRPQWLPGGYPMALILTQKREQLIDELVDDSALRSFLWRKWRAQLEHTLTDELSADTFDATLASAVDADRLVAAGLLHDEHSIARAASTWAQDTSQIPRPQLPAPEESIAQVSAPDPPAAGGREDGATHRDEEEPASVTESEDEWAAHAKRVIVDADGEVAVERAARLVAEEKLGHLARELDTALATIRRLEAANLDLRAKVPTRGDKRRANKDKAELGRAARQLTNVTEQAEALRKERDLLLDRVRTAEENLDEAIEARKSAERSRRSMEERLTTAAGRAQYLRRVLDTEIEAVVNIEARSTAKEKTRARHRADELVALRDLLDRLFPQHPEVVSMPIEERLPRVAVRDERDIRVIPIGGGEEIGGSALLVSLGDRRILVDAGMHPDGGGPRDLARLRDEHRLDAIIITHAHNDHAGYVPALLQRFPAQVIASSATAQLLPTMWNDSARVMQREFEDASEDQPARLPLYGQAEVEQAEQRIVDVPYHRTRRIGDIEYTLFPAGHILGAAGVVIAAGGRRLVVTGDITGPSEEHLAVQPTHLPLGLVRDANLLVIESTYCHSNHSNRQHEVASLVDVVRTVVERRGRVLIPAFGLGRAQEVAMILARELPEVEVLVDGLARTVSEIYENISDGGSLRIFTGRVRPVENRWREMKAFREGVIVSTSGMLNGGPAVQWAKSILPEENDALLLCGYQDEYAPGRRLEEVATRRGSKDFELPDLDHGSVLVPVRAQVQRYRLSAHADKRGLLDIVREVNPAEVMLVHGEARYQRVFRHDLSKAGYAPVSTAERKL